MRWVILAINKLIDAPFYPPTGNFNPSDEMVKAIQRAKDQEDESKIKEEAAELAKGRKDVITYKDVSGVWFHLVVSEDMEEGAWADDKGGRSFRITTDRFNYTDIDWLFLFLLFSVIMTFFYCCLNLVLILRLASIQHCAYASW